MSETRDSAGSTPPAPPFFPVLLTGQSLPNYTPIEALIFSPVEGNLFFSLVHLRVDFGPCG